MKKLVLLFGVFFFGFAGLTIAQPNPGDSMILESKSLAPNMSGDPAFTVRLSITNKDSLTFITLACTEYSLAGSAYALFVGGLGNVDRTFGNIVIPLTNTLRYNGASYFLFYSEASPDKFLIAAGFDPDRGDETIEPPNAVRKAIWELKFKHTSDSLGQVIFDTATISNLKNTFTNTVPMDMPVNYVPAIITLEYLKGDLNGDVMLSAADVTLILNCIFCSACPQPPVGMGECDLNCDGQNSPADVVLELKAVFLGEGFPC